jgi:hypothetical protein
MRILQLRQKEVDLRNDSRLLACNSYKSIMLWHIAASFYKIYQNKDSK